MRGKPVREGKPFDAHCLLPDVDVFRTAEGVRGDLVLAIQLEDAHWVARGHFIAGHPNCRTQIQVFAPIDDGKVECTPICAERSQAIQRGKMIDSTSPRNTCGDLLIKA